MNLDQSLEAAGIGLSHHFGGGVYIKETTVPAGAALVQHKHNFEHLAYLVEGAVLVLVDGETRRIDAPACITIAAGKHHGVRALSPVRWLCIHASATGDEDELVAPGSVDEMQAMLTEIAK